jgi:hypothetical protein
VRPLIDAIDDYVEQITGDRTRLHSQHHSIGQERPASVNQRASIAIGA